MPGGYQTLAAARDQHLQSAQRNMREINQLSADFLNLCRVLRRDFDPHIDFLQDENSAMPALLVESSEVQKFKAYREQHNLAKSLGESEWKNRIRPHVEKLLNQFDATEVQNLGFLCRNPRHHQAEAGNIAEAYNKAVTARQACLEGLTYAARFICYGEYGNGRDSERLRKQQEYDTELKKWQAGYNQACGALNDLVTQFAATYPQDLPQPQKPNMLSSIFHRGPQQQATAADPILTRNDAPRGCCGLC